LAPVVPVAAVAAVAAAETRTSAQERKRNAEITKITLSDQWFSVAVVAEILLRSCVLSQRH
jgi:hypothetical protein